MFNRNKWAKLNRVLLLSVVTLCAGVLGHRVGYAQTAAPLLCGPQGLINEPSLTDVCTDVANRRWEVAYSKLAVQSSSDAEVIALRATCLYAKNQFWTGDTMVEQMVGSTANLPLYNWVMSFKKAAVATFNAANEKVKSDEYARGFAAAQKACAIVSSNTAIKEASSAATAR